MDQNLRQTAHAQTRDTDALMYVCNRDAVKRMEM
jgi:hypothetical protein